MRGSTGVVSLRTPPRRPTSLAPALRRVHGARSSITGSDAWRPCTRDDEGRIDSVIPTDRSVGSENWTAMRAGAHGGWNRPAVWACPLECLDYLGGRLRVRHPAHARQRRPVVPCAEYDRLPLVADGRAAARREALPRASRVCDGVREVLRRRGEVEVVVELCHLCTSPRRLLGRVAVEEAHPRVVRRPHGPKQVAAVPQRCTTPG